jgi:hypothetical protein
VDTMSRIMADGHRAIYGDATRPEILRAAEIEHARYLVVTLADVASRVPLIIARAHDLGERALLEEVGATAVCYEDAEAAIALARVLLREVGADGERVEKEANLSVVSSRWARLSRARRLWCRDLPPRPRSHSRGPERPRQRARRRPRHEAAGEQMARGSRGEAAGTVCGAGHSGGVSRRPRDRWQRPQRPVPGCATFSCRAATPSGALALRIQIDLVYT